MAGTAGVVAVATVDREDVHRDQKANALAFCLETGREMSIIDAPPDVADLHPTCDGWTRSIPWRRSSRRNHYEATYCAKRCLADATSMGIALLEASPAPVRVYINRNIIKNAAAAWEIARQLKAARPVPGRRKRRR